jgi:hypothetical protein
MSDRAAYILIALVTLSLIAYGLMSPSHCHGMRGLLGQHSCDN